MPLVNFLCPDKVTRPISECLVKCPRPEGRCLRLPTLHEVGKDRPWTGKPSTTQSLNPTRMEYLKITKDYAVAPNSRAFVLLGSRHHYKLELAGKELDGIEVEKRLQGDTTGILDLLEPDELADGFYVLTDYKSWGSFAVAKFLGISDADGTYERHQTTLQLNNYRVKVEALGFPVSRLLIQCTVRDGNTKSAFINKIKENMPMLPVERMDDDYVQEYFLYKSYDLLTALENEVMPALCLYEERWNGKRCLKYCEVAKFCPEGAKVTKVTLEE
ncbi:hypothetical protein LCGC14_1549750 [marine sediment metagenome]|uniref:PD-(D/E)XK endonuclease-like domain-containing protein n=1 Tax=marine sediment metagenome TaxID=412755 RepID=A0A0F9IQP0_9ZZZZ